MSVLKLAWHYTVGANMDQIRAAGELRPATAGVPPGEIPVVWFSARQHWEPTANKSIGFPDGSRRFGSFAETIDIGGGGWRFGLPIDRLLGWAALQRAANISRETARGLVRAARQDGADPTFWYGALEPVPVRQCVIQRLDADIWVDAD